MHFVERGKMSVTGTTAVLSEDGRPNSMETEDFFLPSGSYTDPLATLILEFNLSSLRLGKRRNVNRLYSESLSMRIGAYGSKRSFATV